MTVGRYEARRDKVDLEVTIALPVGCEYLGM